MVIKSIVQIFTAAQSYIANIILHDEQHVGHEQKKTEIVFFVNPKLTLNCAIDFQWLECIMLK